MLSRVEKYLLLLCTLNFVRFLHPEKAPSPMDFTNFPMKKVFNFLHPEKGYLLICVKLVNELILLSLAQPLKAFSPIVCVLAPNVTVSNALHVAKA